MVPKCCLTRAQQLVAHKLNIGSTNFLAISNNFYFLGVGVGAGGGSGEIEIKASLIPAELELSLILAKVKAKNTGIRLLGCRGSVIFFDNW